MAMTQTTRENRPTGDKTRSNIISAARKLFAANGFAGTSISQVATKARVTRSLIFHHFASKEELWKAAKASFAAQTDLTVNSGLKTEQKLLPFLQQIMTRRFKLYDENPDIMRIMAWQTLAKEKDILQGGTSASPDSWLKHIKQLQKRGEIKPGLDPELIMLFIGGSISGALLPNPAILKNPKKKQEFLTMTIDALYQTLSRTV
jgi:TetR/AcrR family transcriptional regulator